MKNIIPVVMAGVLGIYGLIMAVILVTNVGKKTTFSAYNGYGALAAGLSCGLSALGTYKTNKLM